jgi:flagellar basal-body rod protein FlgG
MMRSLWTGASGMIGQQFNIDTIANNLANVNTTGFKKNRADFEDLIYQTNRLAGTPATELTVVPTNIQVGHGVRPAASQKLFDEGNLQVSNNKSDLAIDGPGFFRILQYDGSYAYSRDGSFKIDASGQLVTSDGYRVMPEVIIPADAKPESLQISPDGRVSVQLIGNDDYVEIGQIELYRFINPQGLQAIGDNLLLTTAASGDAIGGRPGFDGMGKVRQNMLEMSNVNVIQEMVNMIVAQRAYEFNSKTIQTSDSMLATAVSLKR